MMKQVTHTNLMFFAAAAAAAAATGAILTGCAPPATAPLQPAPVASIPGAVPQPAFPVSTAPQDINGVTELSTLHSSAQTALNSVVGTYTTTYVSEDEDGELVDVPTTVTLTRVTVPSNPGKTYLELGVSAPNGLTVRGLTVVQLGYQYGGNSSLYVTSTPQSAPLIYSNAKVIMSVRADLNYMNQVDPTSSTIRIVDGVFGNDVVYFKDGISKH